ncbi:hypothetical protein M2368_003084 [Arthrobacter sp. JUb119]|nr:hypothetical protein [Arthrobacter sp. JUb119]
MRPKFIALLTVAGLALTGCSSAETPATSPEPISVHPTATEQPTAAPASAGTEEAFIESVEAQIAGKEEALEAELPAEKMTEEYWVERGEVYCEQQAEGELDRPTFKNATEGQLEIVLMGASISTLCPAQ